jgi:hypothetical protein
MTSPHPPRILGVHESKPSGHRFPGAPWGREFVAGPSGTPLPESTTEKQLIDKVLRRIAPHQRNDGAAMVSIKLPLDSVLRGRWDSRLQALGESMLNLPAELIINHEPENDTDDYPPSVFVPAFNRARMCIKYRTTNHGATIPNVNYAGMAYQWAPRRSSTRDAKAWAADLVADRYLADVYLGKTWPQSTPLARHPGLWRFMDEMIFPYAGRRTGLAEFGRLAHRARAVMFAEDFHWLAESGIGQRLAEVVLVWNTGGTERNLGWLLDPQSERVVEIGLSRLAGVAPR